jgi:hypothetical protein
MSKIIDDLLHRTHEITKEQARDLIVCYQENRINIENGRFTGQDILPNAETFNADAINAVLQQDGCMGIRFYYGMDNTNKVMLVATGVDREGNDLDLAIGQDLNPRLMQTAQRCPFTCPEPSQINQ